jgi:hypothetical protein
LVMFSLFFASQTEELKQGKSVSLPLSVFVLMFFCKGRIILSKFLFGLSVRMHQFDSLKNLSSHIDTWPGHSHYHPFLDIPLLLLHIQANLFPTALF